MQAAGHKLLSKVQKACVHYQLLAPADRVLVAISGGKDSYTMLAMLREIQRRAPFSFDLVAVHLDQHQPGYDGTKLYLHVDRRLAPVLGTGGSAAVDYAFDPRDPAPTVGGAFSSGEPVMYAGAFDQSAATRRSDVLVFATPPETAKASQNR